MGHVRLCYPLPRSYNQEVAKRASTPGPCGVPGGQEHAGTGLVALDIADLELPSLFEKWTHALHPHSQDRMAVFSQQVSPHLLGTRGALTPPTRTLETTETTHILNI